MSSTPKSPMSEKGARYLEQLDQALCNGNWPEIQELARKTDKHAPDRKCLTLTARSEAQIASAIHRPTSASSATSSSIHGLGELVPKLNEAITAEKQHPEDVFVANICLAEIHWLREDAEAALQAVQQGTLDARSGGSHAGTLGWIEVCGVKASLIKAAALVSIGKEDEAAHVYLSAADRTPGSRTPELRRWTERLFAHGCMFMYRRTAAPSTHSLSRALCCFMAWSDFWQRSPPTGSSSTSHLDIPRRRVWKAYYDLLSTILQYALIYNDTPSSSSDLLIALSGRTSDDQYTAAKSRQRQALKRVEATYESLILNETQFPKASQTNTEVEEWAQQAVSNWKILCGPEWNDTELGDGGKESVGRSVLDILYRAATKTFHSTAILRHLFTVHAALGEFDLAMHAFDSYVEIVSKGKARAAKTGKHEPGLDGDDIAILTAAEAVRLLCKYGDREQGEKAVEVGKNISKWLAQGRPASADEAKTNGDGSRVQEARRSSRPAESMLEPTTLEAAYRAIGTSQAHWARVTYQTDTRSGLQAEALENLKRAQTHDPDSIETAYALALLLADMRDVSAATRVIKRAIASASSKDVNDDNESDDYSTQIRLMPLWHLLALCLTAKDDYEQGMKMCDAAFGQFSEASTLFGDNSIRISSDSEKPTSISQRGVVDQMDGFEKESILQIKMSQLTFVELTEGVEAAVDITHELLSLYARLFGNPEIAQTVTKPPPTAASTTPSRFGGTLRSIAGSIRPRSAKPGSDRNSILSRPERRPNTGTDDPNGSQIGVPISITVTNEDGVPTEKSHNRHPFKLRGTHGDWRDHGNLKSAKSAENMRRAPSPVPEEKSPPLPEKGTNGIKAPTERPETPVIKTAVEQSQSPDTPTSPEQPLEKVAHNAPHDAWPPPPGHDSQPPRQDVRLPAPHPDSKLIPNTRFPTAQERQHKISLLVDIWLFIAGLYLRADLLEDASGAINEATKLAESFESEVGNEHSSARRFFDKGWGGGRSVDALWADVYSAKGYLSTARQFPFEAIAHYEQALLHYPDHLEGIIGLSNLLMDIYEEKMPAEEPRPRLQDQPLSGGSVFNAPVPPAPESAAPPHEEKKDDSSPGSKTRPPYQDPTPSELNRLASRDRAYMLLSNLTRLGGGWDNSEAWYTLARAHELSKQVDKAKKALWWVVELEDNKPMRPWLDVAPGGFAL